MIKNTPLIFCLIFLVVQNTISFTQSQDRSLGRQLNIETGYSGGWLTLEQPISEAWSIRLEAGVNYTIFGGKKWEGGTGYALSANINLETRYYFDRIRRIHQNKSVKNNSGSFIAMNVHTNPDWFDLSNYENVVNQRYIRIFPSIGLKRGIGDSFFYELGTGVGYGYLLNGQAGTNLHDITYELRLRIGYVIAGKREN
jgi:hypothetical protein